MSGDSGGNLWNSGGRELIPESMCSVLYESVGELDMKSDYG